MDLQKRGASGRFGFVDEAPFVPPSGERQDPLIPNKARGYVPSGIGFGAPVPVPPPQASVSPMQTFPPRPDAPGLSGVAPTPAQTAQAQPDWSPLPGGGSVITPGAKPIADAVEARRQQMSDLEEGLVPDSMRGKGMYTEAELRQMRRELNMKEAKSGIAAEAMIKSISKETGKTREEIGAEIGWQPGSGMSKTQALERLKHQKRGMEIAKKSGIDSKLQEKVTGEAEWETDEQGNRVPTNSQAEAVVAYDTLGETGPDPLSEKTLFDEMTPAQQRQSKQMTEALAKGKDVSEGQRKRFAAMIEKAQAKRDRSYVTKVAKAEKAEADKVIRDAKHKAEVAGEKAKFDKLNKEFDKLGALIKDNIDADDDELAATGIDLIKIRARQKQILDQMKGDVGGGESVAEQIQAANDEAKSLGKTEFTAPDGVTRKVK